MNSSYISKIENLKSNWSQIENQMYSQRSKLYLKILIIFSYKYIKCFKNPIYRLNDPKHDYPITFYPKYLNYYFPIKLNHPNIFFIYLKFI